MLLIYVLTALVFFMIDLIWLGYAAKGLYRRYIGSLLKDRVNWLAAVLFYAIYIGGIQMFVILPAIESGSGLVETAIFGGLLGLFAYSTFDLTCLALLRGWSIPITILDILWGTLLTGGTSAVTIHLVHVIF